MTIDPHCVAVVLAAGAGSRFCGAEHKLASRLAGRPVLQHVLRAVSAAGFGHVLVVTGARRLCDLDPEVHVAVTEVHHERWRDGQATSLHAGIAEARRLGATSVVVGLGDQPGVPAGAWRAVAASRAAIAVATYRGARANPVRLAAAIWPLLPSSGDEGARLLVRSRPDLVEAVACQGEPRDIDTAEDLEGWR